MSTKTPKTTWAEKLTALIASVRNGDTVDPAEFAETQRNADAEAELAAIGTDPLVVRRRQREAVQDQMATGLDKLEADTATVTAATDAAWAAWHKYLDALDVANAAIKARNRQLAGLARTMLRNGYPIADSEHGTDMPDYDPDNKPEIDLKGIRWRGVTHQPAGWVREVPHKYGPWSPHAAHRDRRAKRPAK